MEMQVDVNPYIVASAALLSLAGFYLPGFSGWYEKQASGRKQLIMLLAVLIMVAGRFALGCVGKDVAFACTQDGAFDAAVEFFVAISINAGVYKATNYLQGGGRQTKEPELDFSGDDLIGAG